MPVYKKNVKIGVIKWMSCKAIGDGGKAVMPACREFQLLLRQDLALEKSWGSVQKNIFGEMEVKKLRSP